MQSCLFYTIWTKEIEKLERFILVLFIFLTVIMTVYWLSVCLDGDVILRKNNERSNKKIVFY